MSEQKGLGEFRLTSEQANFAVRQMSRWLRLREQHEDLSKQRGRLGMLDYPDNYESGERLKKAVLTQIAADVDHSALLYRLLRGREPLPEPPLTDHSYPVYPDWPYED